MKKYHAQLIQPIPDDKELSHESRLSKPVLQFMKAIVSVFLWQKLLLSLLLLLFILENQHDFFIDTECS